MMASCSCCRMCSSYFNLGKPWPQWQQTCQANLVARRHRRRLGHLSVSLGIALRETDRAAEAAAALRRADEAYGQACCRPGRRWDSTWRPSTASGISRGGGGCAAGGVRCSTRQRIPFRTAIVLDNLAEAELKSGELEGALSTSPAPATSRWRSGPGRRGDEHETLADVHDGSASGRSRRCYRNAMRPRGRGGSFAR